MTKFEDVTQYLYENAFISIGVFTAVTLCLALAAVEVQRRRRKAIKRASASASASAAMSAVGSANGAALAGNNDEKTD
jgi:hypothetical protein